MKIYLRPIAGKKISKTMNHTFIPLKPIKIRLYPIPMWLKDPKCETCKGPAAYLLKEATPICAVCLNKIIEKSNRYNQDEELSIPLTMDTIKRFAFEWSVDGNKWYRVYGKNIDTQNEKSFIIKMREGLLQNEPVIFDGDYDQKTKIMTIY